MFPGAESVRPGSDTPGKRDKQVHVAEAPVRPPLPLIRVVHALADVSVPSNR